MARKKLLIVDDDAGSRAGLRDVLEARGFEVGEADSCAAACELTVSLQPDAALIGHRLADGDALQLLAQLREIDRDVPLVVLTAHDAIDLAVQAIKEGAEHFLIKPVQPPVLLAVLERVLEHRRVRRKQAAHHARERRDSIDPFRGDSPAIRQLATEARRIVGTESPVLISGETGTGKSLLASWLHANGPRADEAFVDLNCAGLSRDFLETELFGHQKGAFTGAVAAKPGLLEVAHGGTVFLDEIGDVDVQVQPKLLKVLEEKRFRRLGEVRERKVDLCLVAATNQNLAALVREGRFRGDLYFRISAIPLRMPSLRERVQDLPLLVESLLMRIAAEAGCPAVSISGAALNALQRYSWPGNIRELRNVLDRAALLAEGGRIEPRDLRFESLEQASACDDSSRMTLEELERRHIERVLHEEQGKVDAAAKRLGVARSTLYQKIKQYAIA